MSAARVAQTSTPLLEVDGLHVTFDVSGGLIRAVDGVSLSLSAGETLALVGESGCGKSTLARTIMGLERPSAGSVRFDGRDVTALTDRRALARELQMIFQDPDSSLNPRRTLAETLAEPLIIHRRVEKQGVQARVRELLGRVGLDVTMQSRYPHELSGGQRQRVCIARALAVEPRLIVCDEAVSALDVSVQAQILNLLYDLKRDLGLSYLFITHDLGVVRNVADRVSVMYLGRILEEGPAAAVLQTPQNPYTQALMSAVPRLEPGRRRAQVLSGDVPSPLRPPSGCHFHTRCPKVFDRCSREAPPLYELSGERHSRCFLSDPEKPGL